MKRFVVGDEIDGRVNYGLTVKMRFSESMKVQELNYENIPVIEEKKNLSAAEPWCEQLRRRVICCKMGHAKFVKDPADVDESTGKFLLIPQGTNEELLADPIVHSLVFRERLLPFFTAHPVAECIKSVNDVAKIDPGLEADSTWLAKRLSGAPIDEADRGMVDSADSDALVASVHRSTPSKVLIKYYLICEVKELPGLKTANWKSTKGKRSKLDYLDDALDRSQLQILRKDPSHGGYLKLVVNYDKMMCLLAQHGGADVFGGPPVWGDVFYLRDEQKDWEPLRCEAMTELMLGGSEEFLRTRGQKKVVLKMREVVNIKLLMAYAQRKTDRRQVYLEKTIARYLAEGEAIEPSEKGLWSTPTSYYVKKGYGRLMASTYSAQGFTREAKSFAFRTHAVEADQEDCHNMMKYLMLKRAGVSVADEFPIFYRRLRYRSSWFDFCVQYFGHAPVDVKIEDAKLGYGGAPGSDVPFLRRFAK